MVLSAPLAPSAVKDVFSFDSGEPLQYTIPAMPRERILITVKTYPTLSRKYGETVCTAGLHEDSSPKSTAKIDFLP